LARSKSKVIEIHLYPQFVAFADENKFDLVIASHQQYCNGFTLGSHGEYFKNRASTKNIQYPYRDYSGHFCLGVMYSRLEDSAFSDVKIHSLEDLAEITSVIGKLKFFVQEKWRIASDKPGSGNTANIGSIKRIEDIISGNGMFSKLGEAWFDDYWTNYGKIRAKASSGEMKPIQSLNAFVRYRGGDVSKIVPKTMPSARRGK